MIDLRWTREIAVENLMELYEAVGWSAYTRDPQRLGEAVRNSTYVVSLWEGDVLVGLARGLSDDVSIFYLQDVLVRPDYQGRGLGRRLLQCCLERFAHVRQKVLLTDDGARQRSFYTSLGYRNVNDVEVPLTAYVRLDDVEEGGTV